MNLAFNKGFTLIEIMVALVIFAILALITAINLMEAFNSEEKISAKLEQLETIQISLTLISRDLPQMAVRSVYRGAMDYKAAIIAKRDYLEFTRDGFINPGAIEERSTLKRVAYLCQNKQLIRRTWHQLDEPNPKAYDDQILLKKLKKCYFSYLDHRNQMLESFMPKSMHSHQLPRAIGINLEIENEGDLSMIYPIPEGIY